MNYDLMEFARQECLTAFIYDLRHAIDDLGSSAATRVLAKRNFRERWCVDRRKPAGVLMEDDAGRLSFAYSEGASPLSVRMPVRSEVYGPEYAEPFFENSAPEGAARQRIAEKFFFIDNICRRSEVLFNA